MATTDQRAGFRLPWSSDQRSNDRTSDDAPEANADEATAEATVETPVEPAPEAVAHPSDESHDPAETAATEHPALEAAPVSADVTAPASPNTGKRPTKFLADLTKAMQAAAESAREQTLGQLQGDAKAVIEEIHGRSANEASELRRRADDDVAAIRDWSKAEIARVREETEKKISNRKTVLETQLEHHAAVIEREIDRIQGQIGAFESEMAEFFARLLVEEDPTKFAAMAENLPEPPPFEARGLTVDELIEEASAAAAAVAVLDAPTAGEVELEATDSAVTVEAEPTEATAEAVAEGTAEWTEVPMDKAATEGTADADPEVAMAAIQAAFEAAAQAEADAARAEVAADRAEAAAGTSTEDETERSQAVAEAEGETTAEVTSEAATEETGTAEEADGDVAADDPRLAALGLSGFDAAEAEAAALTNGDLGDEIPTIDDDALAARLNGLVPAHDGEQPKKAASSKNTVSSQVIVVGLVSVASIASFKRHLGRISGVQSVGVSSGPDGEFVFAVNHGEDVVLRDLLPSLPGFQARVTNAGDGVVNVTAHDPESEG